MIAKIKKLEQLAKDKYAGPRTWCFDATLSEATFAEIAGFPSYTSLTTDKYILVEGVACRYVKAKSSGVVYVLPNLCKCDLQPHYLGTKTDYVFLVYSCCNVYVVAKIPEKYFK